MNDDMVPKEMYVTAVSKIGDLMFKVVALESKLEARNKIILNMAHDLELLEARVVSPRQK